MSTTRHADHGGIARRALLRTVGGTIAGAVVARQAQGAQRDAIRSHAHDHATAASNLAPQPAPSTVRDALPGALDDHERKTLAVLGEQLVPGSTQAGVPDMLDRLMMVETPEELRRFRNALGAFEHEARAGHAKTWLELDNAQQVGILTRASAGPSAVSQPAPWKPGQPVVPAPAAGPEPPSTLRDHHDYLRGLVTRAYFATEAGMAELGWTGQELWGGLPDCRRE